MVRLESFGNVGEKLGKFCLLLETLGEGRLARERERFIVSYDSANKQIQCKKPLCKK